VQYEKVVVTEVKIIRHYQAIGMFSNGMQELTALSGYSCAPAAEERG
jgi:hypothetical protein